MNAKPLVGYVDADCGSDASDRKSVSCFLFKVFGAVVSWSSKKQSTVALSSTEAEYIAACSAVIEAVRLKGLLHDLNVKAETVTINEDNQGCIAMSKNCKSKRAKHIDIKYHFLREKVMDGSIQLNYINTEMQVADICTKSLARPTFEKHRNQLSIKLREGVEI